jgi:hydrogenase expression/formation protein HypD
MPSVIAGFEPLDILKAVLMLVLQNETGKPALENAYPRAVSDMGNVRAKAVMNQVFEICDTSWRGIGDIPESGMKLKQDYLEFDAGVKFDMTITVSF